MEKNQIEVSTRMKLLPMELPSKEVFLEVKTLKNSVNYY
jgi:hypothetical protein